MQHIVGTSFGALILGCAVAVGMPDGAFAQTNPSATTAPVQQADQSRQVVLTDKQIEGVLASQKEFDSIAEKIPETTTDKPDPKTAAQFDTVAKKYGFASYDEYSDALDTISLILSGVDPKTKKYVGVEAIIKQQIAAIEADKSIPAEDKKQALDQLNDALKTPAPAIQNKANIDLIEKYYDKLSAAMQEEE
jgi:hypothetical protein